jgi:hypothetical protein
MAVTSHQSIGDGFAVQTCLLLLQTHVSELVPLTHGIKKNYITFKSS